jgi:hypothetical protein
LRHLNGLDLLKQNYNHRQLKFSLKILSKFVENYIEIYGILN